MWRCNIPRDFLVLGRYGWYHVREEGQAERPHAMRRHLVALADGENERLPDQLGKVPKREVPVIVWLRRLYRLVGG